MKLGSRALRGALTVALLCGLAAPVVTAPAQAVAPAGETTLLSPGEGVTVGGNPTFSWSAVPGAVKYRIEVAVAPGFASTDVVYNSDTYNRSATPPAALPLGTLHWRVAPTDGTLNGVGSFAYGSFVREWASGPALGVPADGDELTYPEEPLLFTWTPLPGAQKYNVQVDDDVNFVGATSVTTINTSYTLLDPQTSDHTFYWRVQGVSGAVLSPWSDTRSYTVKWPATPVLTGPSPAVPVVDVALDWEPVAGAAKYQVQVSSAMDFSNNIVVNATVLGTRYSPAKALKDDQYYWRVRAMDGKATPNYGPWSQKVHGVDAQFERKWSTAPTLLAPANGDHNVVVPLLKWTPVPYASHYEIWLSTDENFSSAATTNCYTNNTSFAPYGVVFGGNDTADPPGSCGISQSRLPVGSTVFWKVRGIDTGPPGDPLIGAFSEKAEFTFRHDAVPTMTNPPTGADVTSANLAWNAVPGVARYRVNIFQNGSPIAGSPFVTYANSFTPEKLEVGKSYTWYVQTYDDAARPGSFGASRWFTFQAPEALNTEVLHVAPLEGAQSMVMPELSWQPVVNAKKYDVWMGRAGEDLKFQGETNSTTFTPTAVPSASGTYLWAVQARNSLGGELGSLSTPTSFKIGALDLATGLNPGKCGVETPCVASPDTPLLTWNRVPHASGYRVYLAYDAGFQNIVREYKTQHPALTPRESLLDSAAGQPYYYFVRPCRDASLGLGCGPADTAAYQGAGQFRKESTPVSLLSPADGVTVPATGTAVEDITFTWEEYAQTNGAKAAAQGAKAYLIEVATARDFRTDSIVDTDTVDQTTYTPHDVTYPEGPLYWRVRAIDGSGNQLAVSETRLVTKSTPTLTPSDPAPGQVLTVTPYFSWSAQPNTKDYELMVARNGDTNFSTPNLVNLMSTSTSTSTPPPPALTRLTAFTPRVSSLAPGTYAWRVRRLDANSPARPGPWSEVKLFTLTTAAPTLLSPASGAVFNSHDMVFDWTPVEGAVKYEFVASNSPAFGTVIERVQTVMTSWAPSKLYGDGTVYWRVAALNAQGTATAASETRSLFRDMAAPKVTAKTPTTAAGLVGAPFTVTFSEPVKNVSATTFGMSVTSSGAVVPGTVTPPATVETTTATFTPSVPLTPGETYTLALGSAIKDRSGNGLLPFSWNVRTTLTADGASPVVQQFWDRDTSASASGGGYLASRTKGAKVSYSFHGTSASILGRRAPDGGYGEVWVDGAKKATVSFYAASTAWKQSIWSVSGLTAGDHTVELRVLGTKPTASTGYWVYPDVFRHGASALEETSAHVRQTHANTAYSTAMGGSYVLGGHLASGDTGGQPSVSLKFKGTGVYWKGYRRLDGGVAKIYVDGVAKASVDTYGSTSTTATTLWSTGGLTNATHTVKIVFAGTKRTDSKGYHVTVDSFTVS